jgi:hypothetical protein
MQLDKLKKCTDWFRVHSFKDLEDPSGQVGRKEAVVPLDQYPFDFGLGPNPREPVLTSPVSRRIGETLAENWTNFHLLNRGVIVVAKSVDYDNKSQRIRFLLDETPEEERLYGILDGGNTNLRINKWREELEDGAEEKLRETFVNMQILIPHLKGAEPTPEMLGLLNDIKEARNTSVQVKTKSLADARRHFESLKSALQGEPYFKEVSWHEGQGGSVDALQIITLLMMYYPSFCGSAEGGEPSNAYGHKERCLDAFLEYAAKEPDQLEKWIQVLPKTLRLFDEMQVTLPDYYAGRFGKIDEVQIYDERRYERGNKKYRKTPTKSQFFGKTMKYSYPVGWLYPLFAAFRTLAGPDKAGGGVVWKREPVEFWRKHAHEICERYFPHVIAAGYEPKKIATNLLAFQAVRQAVNDLYKDELLKEAGISV